MTQQEVKERLREALENYGPLGKPGKFEGEGPDTMYYYSAMMDGFGEDRGIEGELYSVHDVNAAERTVLDLPEDTIAFVIFEDSQGFVTGTAMNEKKFNRFDQEVSKLEEGDEEY